MSAEERLVPPKGLANLSDDDLRAIVNDPEVLAAEHEQRRRESAAIVHIITRSES